MQQRQASEELDNSPSPFRLQHPPEKPHFIYDEAYNIGVIDAGQHSDMHHIFMMREAFYNANSARSTVIGRLMDGKAGNDTAFIGQSMGDKYAAYLREVPPITQATLDAMMQPHTKNYPRSAYHKGRDIMQCHLSILRKWLDNS
jgi:hypothetical protein